MCWSFLVVHCIVLPSIKENDSVKGPAFCVFDGGTREVGLRRGIKGRVHMFPRFSIIPCLFAHGIKAGLDKSGLSFRGLTNRRGRGDIS